MSDFVKLTALLCLLIATLAFHRIRERRSSIRRLEETHGCKKVPRYPHKDWIWGSDLYNLRKEATKQGQLMKLYEQRFATYGKTFEENFLGSRVINTMNPENIQAVAAGKFQDYRRDMARKGATSPFMGKSITSSDGVEWKHSRNLVKPVFSRSELSDTDGLGVFIDQFLDLIPRDGPTVDIQPLLHKLVSSLSLRIPSIINKQDRVLASRPNSFSGSPCIH